METRHAQEPLMLKGARQVGKTWLMKEFGSREDAYFLSR